MRLNEIRISNIRGIGHCELRDLGRINRLAGPTAGNKSNVADAVRMLSLGTDGYAMLAEGTLRTTRRAPDGDGLILWGIQGLVHEGASTGTVEATGVDQEARRTELKLTVTAPDLKGPVDVSTDAGGETATNRVEFGSDKRWRAVERGRRLFDCGVFEGDAAPDWKALRRRIEERDGDTRAVLEEAAEHARAAAPRLRELQVGEHTQWTDDAGRAHEMEELVPAARAIAGIGVTAAAYAGNVMIVDALETTTWWSKDLEEAIAANRAMMRSLAAAARQHDVQVFLASAAPTEAIAEAGEGESCPVYSALGKVAPGEEEAAAAAARATNRTAPHARG